MIVDETGEVQQLIKNILRDNCFRKERTRKASSDLVVSDFSFFKDNYSEVLKQSSFSTNLCIAEPLDLNYVIHFYRPKKGLLLSSFQWKKCLVLVRKIIKVAYDNLPLVSELGTMSSVTIVTKSTNPRISKSFYHFVSRIIVFLFFC